MTVFQPFLRIELAHAFYGASPPPITLEPDAATARLFRRRDLGVRLTLGAAQIFADRDREDLTDLAAGEPLRFRFRARPTDPSVLACTDTIDLARDRIAVVEIGADATTKIGPENLRPLAVDDVVTATDMLRPPLAILTVEAPADAEDETRRIEFEASRRRWTYHVLGGDAADAIEVRDLDGAVTFDSLGAIPLSNGASSRAFRSQTPIPFSVRPPQRFELVVAGQHGDRVLIPTLPSPRPDAPRPARDDASSPPVSEIYVNLP